MKHVSVALSACLALATCAAGAMTAEELVARNVEAKGGAAALAAVQSLRRSGRLIANGGQFVLDMVETRRRPDSIRVELTVQGLTQVQSYDGHDGWQIDPFGGRKDPERMSADDVKLLVEDADIDGPLVGWREEGSTLDYLGTEDVDGTAAHKLKVTKRGGDVQYVYLDPDWFLEIRIESQRSVRGVQRVSVLDLGDYEKVAGVYWPLSLESRSKGSSDSTKIEYESAKANLPLESAYFSFPAAAAK